jgi:hypothetical protein
MYDFLRFMNLDKCTTMNLIQPLSSISMMCLVNGGLKIKILDCAFDFGLRAGIKSRDFGL